MPFVRYGHLAVPSPARRRWIKTAAAMLATSSWSAFGESNDVALAGFAFAGSKAGMEQRFPYSTEYASDKPRIYARITAETGARPPVNFRLAQDIETLKGRDQAIAVALVVGAETVSTELIAGIHKLFVLVRAQALFFDFKTMAIVRSYPISFAVIDRLDRAPSHQEISARIRAVYEGAEGKPGIFARFATVLEKATLPTTTSRTLQVVRTAIKPDLLPLIPAYLSPTPAAVETWGADLVSEAISTRTGVPMIPFAKGYAIGNVLSMRVLDGTVYELALPKADYEVSVDVTNLRKVEYGRSAAGVSYIYGAYASIRIEEPLSGKTYLDTALKNGEVKTVPVTQASVDDFPAYYDALNLLFVKLSETLAGKTSDWLKTAAAAPDIDRQLVATRELIKLCK